MPRSPEEIPAFLFDLMSKQCGSGAEGEIVLRDGTDGGPRHVLRPLHFKSRQDTQAHLMLVAGTPRNGSLKNELRLYGDETRAIAKPAILYVTGYREVEIEGAETRIQYCRFNFGDPGIELNGNPIAAAALMLVSAAGELARPFPEFVQKQPVLA